MKSINQAIFSLNYQNYDDILQKYTHYDSNDMLRKSAEKRPTMIADWENGERNGQKMHFHGHNWYTSLKFEH